MVINILALAKSCMELCTIHLYTAVFKRHFKAYHFGLKSNKIIKNRSEGALSES